MKSRHQVILSASVLSVAMLSKKRKYEDENRGYETQWEEQPVFVERN
jgi:hypothetical protein